jgi:ferrochelatase
MRTGVLLMSLGSPEKLEDMEAYLLDIRHGMPVSKLFVAEMQERYRQGGGKSPLLEITKNQAEALEKSLNENGKEFKVYVGMRHWHPYITDVMMKIAQDKISTLISFPMTPYYSKLSTEAYHSEVKEEISKIRAQSNQSLETIFIKSWNKEPSLIETFSELIKKGLNHFKDSTQVKLLFTAHSLPEKIVAEQDPYPHELLETARMTAEKLKIKNWDFAYQSQGATKEPWLGPKVEDMLEKYQKEGIKEVLLAPIGFICDHMEILYDVDVLFKKSAREKGIHLERTDSPNDHPLFIAALKSVVLNHLQ